MDACWIVQKQVNVGLSNRKVFCLQMYVLSLEAILTELQNVAQEKESSTGQLFVRTE